MRHGRKHLIETLSDERYTTAIVYKYLSDHLIQNKDIDGLRLLSSLIRASTNFIGDPWNDLYKYVGDAVESRKPVGDNKWYENNISTDDKEKYDRVYEEISIVCR